MSASGLGGMSTGGPSVFDSHTETAIRDAVFNPEVVGGKGRESLPLHLQNWLPDVYGRQTIEDRMDRTQMYLRDKYDCSDATIEDLLDIAKLPPGREVRAEAPAALHSLSSLNSQTGWPRTLSESAYHGLIGDMTRAVDPHSEADPAAILLQSLVLFGNVVGRAPHFQVEADRHSLNEFVVLVGRTSKSRKGTSLGQAKRFFEAIDPEWLKKFRSGLSSGEGLIWAVRDDDTDPGDQAAGGAGLVDKRLVVTENEFASVLKVASRQGNTLSPLIRRAWDGGPLETMTKNSPAKATDAHISIIAHITKRELRRYLSATETGNGFANRFLFVCVDRSKLLPFGGNLDEQTLQPLIDRLQIAVEFANTVGKIGWTPDAGDLWRANYERVSEGGFGVFGAVTSRGEAHVLRLASTYALLDKADRIGVEHLRAALEVWRYCEESARHVFGDAVGDPTADRILEALRSSPDGLTRTYIQNTVFKNHKSAADLNLAFGVLELANLVGRTVSPTDGRPAEMWKAL